MSTVERIGREPAQRRGESKQDYETQPELLAAVVRRFGALSFDLACSGPSNAKAPHFFTEAQDSLAQDWAQLGGNLWLNPPFTRIDPWAAKCRAFAPRGGPRRILFLTPASVGSAWFAAHVHGAALVLALNPRLRFVGASDDYPKDCILSVFGAAPDFDVWRWEATKGTP
jgi:phage N-6-adenine-methyltransferase